jgi:hypothetical protein
MLKKGFSTMKRFLFGGSCLGMATLCLLSAFLILLVGSVLLTQSQVSSELHDAVPIQVSKPAPLKTQISPTSRVALDNPQVGVTIEIPNQPTNTLQSPVPVSASATSSHRNNPTVASFITATPGNAPLGADVYELTLTAQIVLNRTRGAAQRQAIWSTRTAIADESRRIFATLTAEAYLSSTPTSK